ncbi:MAG TPA: hypothetical protein VGQ93_01020, partial [Lysobacter sp.]|nr:hypothetical protein [Lysobacter sp.]
RAPSLTHGSDAEFVGWSTVADSERPAPPLVHLVFRAQEIGVQDTFISGARTRRPDIAGNDKKLIAAGLHARGLVPEKPGNYNLFVWVGDRAKQIECDTGLALSIR